MGINEPVKTKLIYTKQQKNKTYFILLNMNTPQSLLDEYIRSLSEKEYKGYMIAKSHLGSSFDLGKSTGFIDWLKARKTNSQEEHRPS
jgi:hypothetical protein